MIIEFSGETTGSVIMFGKVAKQLLKMMGQSGNDEGAIRAPDVPGALEKLNAALESVPKVENEQDTYEDDKDAEISIHTRATPLVDLLEESVRENGYVMWKPQ